MSIDTLADLFLVAAGYHKPHCLLHKVDGEYRPLSTAELVDGVRRLARALEKLGVGRGDRVALMADNGPHWPTIHFATLCRGRRCRRTCSRCGRTCSSRCRGSTRSSSRECATPVSTAGLAALAARSQDAVASSPPLRRKLFEWALDVGRQSLPWALQEEHPPGALGLKLALANALVFRKTKARLGGRPSAQYRAGTMKQRDGRWCLASRRTHVDIGSASPTVPRLAS